MIQHYNIGTATEINPFEHVKYVKLASCIHGTESLHRMLNKRSEEVITRKVNDMWIILYDIKYLDFNTIIKWFDSTRGAFQVKSGYGGYKSVHFLIEEDILSVW